MTDKLIEFIKKKRRIFLFISYVLIVFIGSITYPIDSFQKFLDWSPLLELYFFISLILYILYYKRIKDIFFTTFIYNAIGLFIRVFIEWSQNSILGKEFTLLNISVYLILVPIFITSVNIILPRLKNE